MNKQHEQLSICENFEEAAKSILNHSFAILRTDNVTKEALEKSWIASRNFLSHVQNNTIAVKNNSQKGSSSCTDSKKARVNKEQYLSKYRIVRGHLLGLNFPSEAKVLYRAFYDRGVEYVDENVETQEQQLQPWPNDFDGGELMCCSNDLSAKLHNTLISCLRNILLEVKKIHGKTITSRETTTTSYSNKRKLEYYVDCDEHQYNKQKQHVASQSQRCGNFDNNEKTMMCPLDYFLYHNLDHNAINCSAHIDRGVLICISLTNVQGLEILSNESNEWVCPEDLSVLEGFHSEIEAGCSDLLCILSGDQLLKIVKKEVDPKDLVLEDDCPGLVACIHRVRQRLKRARLSISYELRLP